MTLTVKQQRFIEDYLIHGNATRAAVNAGYSEKTARIIGFENLTKPNIASEIERRLKERSMGKDEVLDRIADIARADMEEFLDRSVPGFPMFDFDKADKAGKLHLIKKYKVTRQGVEVQFYDKLHALELMAKHHALLTERTEEHVFTWEDRAIADIKAGILTFKELADGFDVDLATRLFERAGVSVSTK